MKKILSFGAMALIVAAGVSSCDEPVNNGYEGTNYIYLISENTSMYGVAGESIDVDVMLTTALDEDIDLTFAVSGEGRASVEISGNPVSIPAGSREGSFSLVCGDDIALDENLSLSVILDPTASNPEGLDINEAFQFTVIAVSNPDDTPEQEEILGGFMEATGIDLSGYIGLIDVTVQYTGTDPDTGEPLAVQTITGKTEITLSESSQPGKPVLKMLSNPMGIQDKMYEALRAVTVDNTDYWYGEWASACYGILMEAIDWTPDSDEQFIMSLDNIAVNENGSINFLGEGLNQYDDPITIVPFGYSFSAYDRELAAIADGTLDPENTPDWAGDCTANPAYHLNCDEISEDVWEGTNWIEPAASVSNESMKFSFCIYRCSFDSDYTRIEVTYTPKAAVPAE